MALTAEGNAVTAAVTGGLLPESRRVTAGALRLHCLCWGEPADPVALLVHGNGGHAHWWDPIVPALVPGWRLIVPNLRGHGDSDWPEPPRYRIEDFAGDLLGVLEEIGGSRRSAVGSGQLGTADSGKAKRKTQNAKGKSADTDEERVVLVGHSMGGRACAWLAMRYPERVRALALFDTHLGSVDAAIAQRYRGRISGRRQGRGYRTREEAIAAFRFVPDERDVAPAIVTDLAYHAVYERAPHDWTFRFDRAVLSLAGDGGGNLIASLDRIRCPTLVVNGQHSRLMDAAECNAVKAAIPRAAVHTVPGGHHFLVAHPERVTRLLRAFLEELPPKRRENRTTDKPSAGFARNPNSSPAGRG